MIPQNWIDSYDLAQEGKLSASILRSSYTKLDENVNSLIVQYGKLMRTSGSEIELQVLELNNSKLELMRLIETLTEIQQNLMIVGQKINSYQPLLEGLLSIYIPEDPNSPENLQNEIIE